MIIHIGTADFDPNAAVLVRGDGSTTSLRPQTVQVLSILVANAGQLVSKGALMDEVWADTHVTDDSLVQCISEIRRALGEPDGALVKTVPRQGYKLVAADGRSGDPRPQTQAAPASRRTWVRGMVSAAVLAVVAVTVVMVFSNRQSGSAAPKVIAVLPFENSSGDPGQAYLSNGLAQDLITSLSGISDLNVVSRSASFTVASEFADPRDIAQELLASHLVEGSVRREGDHLRLTTALVDGRTGRNIWTDTHEGQASEIFEFQKAALSDIVRKLSVRLSSSERKRLGVRGTTDADAFDLYLRGMEALNFFDRTANHEAEAALDEALRRDPDFAAAHAQLSLTLSMQAEYDWTDDRQDRIHTALDHAARAISLDPELPFAWFASGRLKSRQFVGDNMGALSDFERAIELDPNYTDAQAFAANVLVFLGRAEDARAQIEAAIARNPRPPFWYFVPLGISNLYLGNYEAAETALLRVLDGNPNSPHALRNLIVLYGLTNRLDDAEWMIFEYEAKGFPTSIATIMATSGTRDSAYRAKFEEGLRRAGMPD